MTTNFLVNPVYVNVGSDPFEVIGEAVRYMSTSNSVRFLWILMLGCELCELWIVLSITSGFFSRIIANCCFCVENLLLDDRPFC